MTELVPNRFLCKFELSIKRCPDAMKTNGDLTDWASYRLPNLCELDGEPPFAELYAAWNPGGLYIGCQVSGKRVPLRCDPDEFWKSDNVRVMTDMRDTRSIHRATRFCQQFYLLPTGGGNRNKQAMAGGALVHRAAEDAPTASPDEIPIASKVTKKGYALTAHLPAAVLNGFDPEENPRIGLLIVVEDLELGQQSFTVGDDLKWWIDPSTWPVAKLLP